MATLMAELWTYGMIYKETEHLQSKSSIQLKEQSEPYPAIGK